MDKEYICDGCDSAVIEIRTISRYTTKDGDIWLCDACVRDIVYTHYCDMGMDAKNAREHRE